MVYHVISYLEAAAAHFPEKIALASKEKQLTYGALLQKTAVIGSAIYERLGATKQPVFVGLRHDIDDIVAFLSIAYSGNFYVPIDPSLPAHRLCSMAQLIRPVAILGEIPAISAPEHWSLSMLEQSAAMPAAPWMRCKDTDLLYVIFTSGSSGTPKGVAVRHRSVIDMTEQFAKTFAFDEHCVFGNQAPFDFDVSVKDIYLTLKTGGRLELLEKQLFSFPKLLIARLIERQVNTIIWAVPALNIIAALKAFAKETPPLNNVLFSGEVMPPNTLKYWREYLPNARYVNLYGPTEITCNCTYHIISSDESLSEGIPIGLPFPNCDVFLLEGDRLITQPETIGELCVTGTCLAAGYYGQTELTLGAFVQNPLEPALPERMYRTGDMGIWKHGQLFFLGRKDTQIKHMGHRIELGEIELCANQFPGVNASVCVYLQQCARIILCYQGGADARALRDALKSALPKYMLPSELRPVSQFPRTRTGKIDRNALMNLIKGE